MEILATQLLLALGIMGTFGLITYFIKTKKK